MKRLIFALCSPIINNTRKTRVFFLISFFCICASVFLTIIGQIPPFSSRGLTHLFSISWLVVLLPVVLLDYRTFIKKLLLITALLAPFLLYLLIALFFKIPSYEFEGTKQILLSSYVLLISLCVGKYFTKTHKRLLLFLYYVAAVLYGIIVYVSRLRGIDVSGPMYALSTKNSTGPILLIGMFCAFYVFSKNNFINAVIRIVSLLFFVALIGLMKCRTVLIALPIIIAMIIYHQINNKIIKFSLLALLVAVPVVVFSVPQLYKTIVLDIMLNGRTNIDDIFSGRISSIVLEFQRFKPILGSGNTYLDCMPICFLCCYGIVGLFALLPFLSFPFAVLFKKSNNESPEFKLFVILTIILFLSEFLFEGFGYIGPGARSFIFWLVVGIKYSHVTFRLKSCSNNNVQLFDEKINRIKPATFMICTCGLAALIFNVAVGSKLFGSDINSTIVSKLPSSSVIVPYEEPGKIYLQYEDTICVGQTIQVDFVADNKKCPDVQGNIHSWSAQQDQYIRINAATNSITALQTGTACFGYRIIRKNPGYAYIKIVRPEDFAFDNIRIFGSKTKNVSDDIIIGEGLTTKIDYDNDYIPKNLPQNMEFKFFSSNTSIATIDNNGQIYATTSGECYVYACLLVNGIAKYQSNQLRVVVKDHDSFTPLTSISLKLEDADNYYQYSKYSFELLFNDGASFTKCEFDVSGGDYVIQDNKIQFLEPNEYTLVAKSLSYSSIKSNTVIVSIFEDKPLEFSCYTNRVLVGRTYTTKELNITLNYSSGKEVLVEDDDLFKEPGDFKGRAWTETNGLIKNNSTLLLVKTGTATIKLVSCIDRKIEASFSFEVTKYTDDEIEIICQKVLYVLSLILLSLQFVLSLFIDYKYKYGKLIANTAILIDSLIMLCVIFGFKVSAIIIYTLLFIGFNILEYFVLKNKTPEILNTSAIAVCQNTEKDFLTVDI